MQHNLIQLTTKSANIVDHKTKAEALTKIAILDTDVLKFLGELASSEKAVKKLMNNQGLIRTMVF